MSCGLGGCSIHIHLMSSVGCVCGWFLFYFLSVLLTRISFVVIVDSLVLVWRCQIRSHVYHMFFCTSVIYFLIILLECKDLFVISSSELFICSCAIRILLCLGEEHNFTTWCRILVDNDGKVVVLLLLWQFEIYLKTFSRCFNFQPYAVFIFLSLFLDLCLETFLSLLMFQCASYWVVISLISFPVFWNFCDGSNELREFQVLSSLEHETSNFRNYVLILLISPS